MRFSAPVHGLAAYSRGDCIHVVLGLAWLYFTCPVYYRRSQKGGTMQRKLPFEVICIVLIGIIIQTIFLARAPHGALAGLWVGRLNFSLLQYSVQHPFQHSAGVALIVFILGVGVAMWKQLHLRTYAISEMCFGVLVAYNIIFHTELAFFRAVLDAANVTPFHMPPQPVGIALALGSAVYLVGRGFTNLLDAVQVKPRSYKYEAVATR
jgi:hypothetical protein